MTKKKQRRSIPTKDKIIEAARKVLVKKGNAELVSILDISLYHFAVNN